MKQTLITLALVLLVMWGLAYWVIAAKVFIDAQGDKGTSKVPCIVIGTRADEAMDLHMHLTELSNPDFLKKFSDLSKQPMAHVEFPLLGSKAGVPLGRDVSGLTRTFIDSSFAKCIFPFTYQVDGKDYVGTQAVYPVPMWIDPRPDFSKTTSWASFDPAHPEIASCAAIVWWQISKLFAVGLLLIAVPSVFIFLANQPTKTASDKAIDDIYDARFGKNRR